MAKRVLVYVATFGAAFLLCAANGRGDGNEGMRGSRNIFKMRRVAVSQPYRFERPENVVDDSHRAVEPRSFEGGETIRQQRETKPPVQHAAITRNEELVRNLQNEQRGEALHNHYYWHEAGGVRYAHFFDDHGIHWYGFYHGSSFYWCRYFGDQWWWYDAAFTRWVFWWDGYWRWWGPGGIAYVYVDNNYYPYDMTTGAVVVQKPETANPPKNPPPPGEGQKWISPDKSRIVQIYGENSEAFLYDNSEQQPGYMAYLGRDIVKIRFSQEIPAQILADFKDGAFALYDMDGNPKKTPPSKPPQVTQPPAPESVPIPPTSAPGQ